MSGKDKTNENEDNTGNVDQTSDDVTINNDGAGDAMAAGGTAEDADEKLQKIIDAQNEQIEKLVANTESLQNQIGVLLRGGASITDGKSDENTADGDKDDEYTPLSELGAEMGKRRYNNVNLKE